MAVKDSILAVLSVEPSTGYDLKKKLADLAPFSWIATTQIYKVLDDFQKEGLASVEVDTSDDLGRKVYAITPKGKKLVQAWLEDDSNLPDIKNEFHQRLLIAALKDDYELSIELLLDYQSRLQHEISTDTKKRKHKEKVEKITSHSDNEDVGDLDSVDSYQKPSERVQAAIPKALDTYRLSMLKAELLWTESLIRTLKRS